MNPYHDEEGKFDNAPGTPGGAVGGPGGTRGGSIPTPVQPPELKPDHTGPVKQVMLRSANNPARKSSGSGYSVYDTGGQALVSGLLQRDDNTRTRRMIRGTYRGS